MRGLTVLLAVAGLLAVGVSSAGAAVIRQVKAQNRHFTPHSIIAVTGDSVNWKNADGVNHDLAANNSAFTETLSPQEEFDFPFPTPGMYGYRCTLHPGMTGTVKVYDLFFAGPPSAVLYGKTAAMSGYAPEDSTVDIFVEGDATPVESVMSHAATGRFTASLPAVPGRYKAVSELRESAWVQVNVKPKLKVTSRKKGKAFWITVSTAPNQSGGKMLLERRKGPGWKKLGSHTLGATSKTVFKVVPKEKMQVRLRLSVPVGGYAKSTSGTLTLRP